MSTDKRLEGKVAVITGGGSGIGKATALLFAEKGAKVVVADINADTAAETAKMIKDLKGQATAVQVDVSKESDIEKMIRTAVETYGKLDILFNNAAIAGKPDTGLETSSEEDWNHVMSVNLNSVFLGCKHAIPQMRRNGSGSIISTASIGGIRGAGRCPAYNVSKAGIILYTMSLATVLGKDNIRVNCLCPGGTETGMTPAFMQLTGDPQKDGEKRKAAAEGSPLGRMGDPKDMAYAVLFLASDESSFVTGHSLVVDGGRLAKIK